MAVRLGLGLAQGTARKVGIALVALAVPIWIAGFGAVGVLLVVVGATVLLERRRSVPSLSKDS